MPIYDEAQRSFPSPIVVTVPCLQNLAKALQSVVEHNRTAIHRAKDDEIALYGGRPEDNDRLEDRARVREENAQLSWNATFSDGSRKTGLKLAELLELPNYDAKPITEIHVACGRASVDGAASGNCTLRAGPFGTGYSYSLSGTDQLVSHVSKDLDNLYSQLKPKYSSITRFRGVWGFFTALTAIVALLFVLKWRGITIPEDFAGTTLIAASVGLWYFFAEIVIPWWWPKWECEIGAGKDRSQHRKSRRTNVFYGVFIALALGLLILAVDRALSKATPPSASLPPHMISPA